MNLIFPYYKLHMLYDCSCFILSTFRVIYLLVNFSCNCLRQNTFDGIHRVIKRIRYISSPTTITASNTGETNAGEKQHSDEAVLVRIFPQEFNLWQSWNYCLVKKCLLKQSLGIAPHIWYYGFLHLQDFCRIVLCHCTYNSIELT